MDFKIDRSIGLTSGSRSTTSKVSSTTQEANLNQLLDRTSTAGLSQRVQVRQSVTSIEGARSLTSEIADQLAQSFSQLSREELIQASTGSLDPVRVQNLLSDD